MTGKYSLRAKLAHDGKNIPALARGNGYQYGHMKSEESMPLWVAYLFIGRAELGAQAGPGGIDPHAVVLDKNGRRLASHTVTTYYVQIGRACLGIPRYGPNTHRTAFVTKEIGRLVAEYQGQGGTHNPAVEEALEYYGYELRTSLRNMKRHYNQVGTLICDKTIANVPAIIISLSSLKLQRWCPIIGPMSRPQLYINWPYNNTNTILVGRRQQEGVDRGTPGTCENQVTGRPEGLVGARRGNHTDPIESSGAGGGAGGRADNQKETRNQRGAHKRTGIGHIRTVKETERPQCINQTRDAQRG
jgi:hypothetical protein